MANENVTAQRLRDLLRYEPETGEFIWRAHRKGRHSIEGKQAGFVNRRGYRIFGIDGRPVQAHRAAWLYIYGEWPKGVIDHLNGVKTDNRIANLFCTTNLLNNQNIVCATVRSKSGFRGVSKSPLKGDRWDARICHSGIHKFIGTFSTPEEAHAAYLAEKKRVHHVHLPS